MISRLTALTLQGFGVWLLLMWIADPNTISATMTQSWNHYEQVLTYCWGAMLALATILLDTMTSIYNAYVELRSVLNNGSTTHGL